MRLPVPHHTALRVGTEGDWIVWSYRSATVRSLGRANKLIMSGHPYDGTYHPILDACFQLVHFWLDHGEVPPSGTAPFSSRI